MSKTVQPNKKQKVDDNNTKYKEEVLFNSDTLSKVISYLPWTDLLNLALTCKLFGESNNEDSLIKESVRIAIQDIATEEQLATLPYYNGQVRVVLANYHYLQLMRGPLTFDQLIGGAKYVNSGDKSCVTSGNSWGTAISNNILRTGKHYVTFEVHCSMVAAHLGVMRPGKPTSNASGTPLRQRFFQHFSRTHESNNNKVHCCMCNAHNGKCYTSDWELGTTSIIETWEGMENMSSGDEIGMLLDLDEGALTVYKNGRRLGVMKRGLAGPYCWVAHTYEGVQVTIKRGTIPPPS